MKKRNLTGLVLITSLALTAASRTARACSDGTANQVVVGPNGNDFGGATPPANALNNCENPASFRAGRLIMQSRLANQPGGTTQVNYLWFLPGIYYLAGTIQVTSADSPNQRLGLWNYWSNRAEWHGDSNVVFSGATPLVQGGTNSSGVGSTYLNVGNQRSDAAWGDDGHRILPARGPAFIIDFVNGGTFYDNNCTLSGQVGARLLYAQPGLRAGSRLVINNAYTQTKLTVLSADQNGYGCFNNGEFYAALGAGAAQYRVHGQQTAYYEGISTNAPDSAHFVQDPLGSNCTPSYVCSGMPTNSVLNMAQLSTLLRTDSTTHDFYISNIQFMHTTRQSTFNAVASTSWYPVQADFNYDATGNSLMPAAVEIHGGQNVFMYGDIVAHTGTTGVAMYGGSGNVVGWNSFSDIGGSAISVYTADGTVNTSAGYGHTIAYNYITGTGFSYAGSVGIFQVACSGCNTSYNEIDNSRYTGLSVGWETFWNDGNTVANNRISEAMTKDLDGGLNYGDRIDGAALYLRGNAAHGGNWGYVHDNMTVNIYQGLAYSLSTPPYPNPRSSGFYLDESAMYWSLVENYADATFYGYKFNECRGVAYNALQSNRSVNNYADAASTEGSCLDSQAVTGMQHEYDNGLYVFNPSTYWDQTTFTNDFYYIYNHAGTADVSNCALTQHLDAISAMPRPTISILPAGFFFVGGGGYYANSGGHYCVFTSWPNYLAAGGPNAMPGTLGGAVFFPAIPPTMIYDGACN